MRDKLRLMILAVIAGGLMMVARPAAAQYTTATLGGTVTDASGAVVPGAKVTARSTDTGLAKTITTTANGAYLFPALPVGHYDLTVEKSGFSTYVQRGITLTVNQAATQPVTLQVGLTSQQVTVSANARMINTHDATTGQLVGTRQILSLPLEGRQAQSLVFLAPGTINTTGQYCGYNCQGGVYPGAQEAAVNGGGTANVSYQMDGADHNDTYVNMNLPFPNPDAIQEFNLQSDNMSAAYGNAASVVDIVTKSGTNQFHGDAFEFVRNGDLNARNFFAPSHDTLKRNQFGGTFGGPIKKDKLFFFGTYQGTRVRQAATGNVAFVPTAAERGGDFYAISKQLLDPVSGAPFPNNQIPTSRLSAPSLFFLQHIPLPNGPGGQLTFLGPEDVQTQDEFMTKIDYIRGKNQLSGRYFYANFQEPPDLAAAKVNLLAMDGCANSERAQTVALNDTYSASATLLFNTWFGYDRQTGGTLSGAPFGFPDAGIKISPPAAGAPAMEAVNVGSFFAFDSGHLGVFDRNDWRIREVVTMQRGSHELLFGGETFHIGTPEQNTNAQSGIFRFTGALSGLNLADFMVGQVTQLVQKAGAYYNYGGQEMSLFVQDNWRVNRKLTLNMGLRWDPYRPYTDTLNRIACWRPGSHSARYPNAPTGIIYAGDPGCPPGGTNNDLANFAPRLGFAYQLGHNTVFRGGAGIYYTVPQTSMVNGISNAAPFAPQFVLQDVNFQDQWG
ncbi:MAG: TonB-dependent receptor domain-containing protein, partial [Terriglobia bacterium]